MAGALRTPRFLLLAAALVVAVFAIYGQVYDHQFIAYDDDSYIYTVSEVQDGLTLHGLRWAFDGAHAGNYHPLTWLSHMLDVSLFGLRPGGHHVMNVAFHAANAVLLAGVLISATGAFRPGAAVAALFALHPLRVESVAWASERKDVLSTLFGLLALAAYVRAVRRPGIGRTLADFGLAPRHLAVLGLFFLGLLAKPMLVTLPFALLLLDFWPLGRFRAAGTGGATATAFRERPWVRPALEKLPLLLLSAAWSLLTVWAQTTDVLPIVKPAFLTRLGNAALSYVKYLGSFVWPAQLAFLYPYPTEGGAVAVSPAASIVAAAILVAITAVVIVYAKRRPFLPMGWFWYAGMLVPVIGLVQVGGQERSDRYTYLTTTGIAIAFVWLAAANWPRRAGLRRALGAGFLLVLALLGTVAWTYTGYWRDSLRLFAYTVDRTRDNYLVLNNYGTALMQANRIDEAIKWLRETARVNPEHCNAHYNLGVALVKQDRFTEAVIPLLRSLKCYEDEGRVGIYIADTHYNLGVALSGMGKYAEAESHLRAALAIAPRYPGASAALGETLRRKALTSGAPAATRP
ncbi:MAG TPA: tetratricopeptide repeat protein [bacterium]